MASKICSRCKITKSEIDFRKEASKQDGLSSACKSCLKESYKKNKEYNSARHKKYYQDNLEYFKNYNKDYNQKNPEKFKIYHAKQRSENPEKFRLRQEKFRINNPNKIKAYNLKYKTDKSKQNKIRQDRLFRRKNDPFYKLKCTLRSRITSFLKDKKFSKKSKCEVILGSEYIFVKNHIENLFQKGMSWKNHGEWHIDHKIPLSYAKNEKDLLLLMHYSNLQPLWAKDNLKKGKKIGITEIQISI